VANHSETALPATSIPATDDATGMSRRLRLAMMIVFALSVIAAAGYWWLNGVAEGPGLERAHQATTDKTGTYAINPQFGDAAPFSEGLAFVLVGDERTGKVGYIDKAGKMVIAPRFDSGVVPPFLLADRSFNDGYVFRAGKFSEGLAAVRVGDESRSRYGYIDKTGKLVIDTQFDYVKDFSGGLAAIRIGDEHTGRFGYIDRNGKVAINPQFGFAHNFSEGLAEVEVGNRYGYIDKSGTMVVPPLSEVGNPRFSEGLVSMMIGGRWGYFDKAGKVAINPQFDFAFEFSEGLASVRLGKGDTAKWGYIDKAG
jgi:hypothetical protein